MELAGIDIPDDMDTQNLFEGPQREYIYSARDRCEWAVDRTRSVMGDGYHYIKNFMIDRPLAQHNFRDFWPSVQEIRQMWDRGELTPAQGYPYGPRPVEELYDLKEDPNELTNLADDPNHKEMLVNMRYLMQAWIEEVDDKGQYSESKAALAVTKKQFGKFCTDPLFDDV